MPFERLGKVRESLTVNTELYKKLMLRYLDARGYTVKASSDVEGTFADVILTRAGEKRDYWLEVKDTEVSLDNGEFLKELAKYLAAYLSRTPENRFKMMLACDRVTNIPLFKAIYEQFEYSAISGVVAKMVSLSDPTTQKVIQSANPVDIKRFFEDTDVKEVDIKFLLKACEKVKPTPPANPTFTDAEYASKIMQEFGDVSPISSKDQIFLNIFELELPTKLYLAKTSYRSSNDIFAEKPKTTFPAFDLDSNQITTFDSFAKENPLTDFIEPDSAIEVNFDKFLNSVNNEACIIKILNRWIKARCRKMGLVFDDRTKAYYYPKVANTENGAITATWNAPTKESSRQLTTPMISNNKVNFWVHRAAVISAKTFWSNFYIQIKPRFLFSPDGTTLYDGPKADKLDRNFRKSRFSHNLNQLYDVLFWYRHVFPESENLAVERIDVCLGFNAKQSIRILNQVSVMGECKPNNEQVEDLDALEKIEADLTNEETLDAYLGDDADA